VRRRRKFKPVSLARDMVNGESEGGFGPIMVDMHQQGGGGATPNARLMVVESVIPGTPEFDMGKWMDLNMIMMSTGRERTAAEFRGLLARAGFELEQIVPARSPLSIVVGKPTA
jgi:hypothetical protein